MYFNLATTFHERYYNTTLHKFQSFFCGTKHACIALFECHIECYFTMGPKIDTPTAVGGWHHSV